MMIKYVTVVDSIISAVGRSIEKKPMPEGGGGGLFSRVFFKPELAQHNVEYRFMK
jgi:hypothetical protein